MRRVLVTDGEQRSALAIVRSLGRAGMWLGVAGGRNRVLAGASRYCRGQERVPDPLSRPGEFVGALAALVERWSIDTLIPVSDASLLTVLAAADRLPGVRIPFPDLERVRQASDKAAVARLAAEVGIAVPASIELCGPGQVPREQLRFPLVIKPVRSVVEGVAGKFTVSHAADAEQLERRLGALPPEAYPVLLQQRIRGPGVGVFALHWDGALHAVFAHRRLREKPPSGGISVYRESIAPDPGLVEPALELLRRLAWNGVAMVEMKVDEDTGVAYLMEINGRFWGSLQLAIDAGVDFPRLLLEAADGATPPSSPPAYRAGVRSRWLWGDVDHLLLRLRRSTAALDLPQDGGGRAAALTDFARLRRGDRLEVLRSDDPGPFLRESMDWIRRR